MLEDGEPEGRRWLSLIRHGTAWLPTLGHTPGRLLVEEVVRALRRLVPVAEEMAR